MSKIPQDALTAELLEALKEILALTDDPANDADPEESAFANARAVVVKADAARAQGAEVEPVAWQWRWKNNSCPWDQGRVPNWVKEAGDVVEERALCTTPPAPQPTEREKVLDAFEKAYPELYWIVGRGKISAGEPLYGAIIKTMFGTEIGHGESDVSLDEAFNVAIRNAGLAWPALAGGEA